MSLNTSGGISNYESIKTYQYTMPDVKGMGLRDAVYLLENAGLKVGVVGTGKVVMQSIPAGQAIGKGTYITIRLNW